MESMWILSLVVALTVAPATPLTVQCINGNCTETNDAPVFGLNIGSIFPQFLFGPVETEAESDRQPFDEVIDPMQPAMNDSEPSGGIFSIHVMRIFSFGPNLDDQPDQADDFGNPLLDRLLNMIDDLGYLDLSGRNLTSDEVYAELKARKATGRPVKHLNLSNSRVSPMDAGTFAAAESDLEILDLSNTSVNLDALRGLTNLKALNLSNNGLSTFPWLGLMADTLETLDLSNNRFEEIRPELSMLKSLRHLYLSNNKIASVEKDPLRLLPDLESLDLSMNVLDTVNVAELKNLNQLKLDWNYLRLMGRDVLLPPQTLTLTLASNPWRCDCGLLMARDNNEVLDLDLLQCANYQSYSICDDCPRIFLPPIDSPDRRAVLEMTKDSIKHLDCFDLPELYNAMVRLQQDEPDKFAADVCLFVSLLILLVVAVSLVVVRCCCKKPGRKFWLQVHQIPHLEKIGKPQEVPYIKIDEPLVKV